MEVRCISKNFRCDNCLTRFRKLVQYDSQTTRCEHCGEESANTVEEGEFNREEADRTYRIAFNNINDARQYHHRFDTLDRNRNNLYGDPRRPAAERVSSIPRVEPQQTTTRTSPAGTTRSTSQRVIPHILHQIFIPYSISPFNGSVRSFGMTQDFVQNLFDDFFTIPNIGFFNDNFASNFSSNFDDPLTRIVFMESMQNQPSGSPPTSKEAIQKLKKFKMNSEFCKKSDKGKLECPDCSICLTEIEIEQDTLLIPCGHMFHDSCILKWLDSHSTCPVCRYELPNDNNSRNQNHQVNGNHFMRV